MTQQSYGNGLTEILKLVMPSIIGILGGLLGGWFASRLKIKEINETFNLQAIQRNKEEEAKLKLQYLDPLRIATEDLLERLIDVMNRLERGDTLLSDTIRQIKFNNSNHAERFEYEVKYELWENESDFFYWANDMGHFTMSTLYLTAVYFACASRLRYDLPQIELSYSDDAELLGCLDFVRKKMGGPYGIWEDLQDSIGSYIRKENSSLMNYREFCQVFFEKDRYLWYLRLIDFYGDFHLKKKYEIRAMIDGLRRLSVFLKTRSKMQSNSI